MDKPEMLTVQDYLDIRTAHAQGESIRGIARRLRRAQKTVRKVVASDGQPKPYARAEPAPLPKLGPFTSVIDRIITDDASAPPKQRHIAMQVWRRLCQRAPI